MIHNYQTLCTIVYDLSKPEPPAAAYAFYQTYAQRAAGLILEPMCGTGRFLIPMLEDGFKVQGFDASASMLMALRTKLLAKGHTTDAIWQALTTQLERAERYALMFIPSGSFGLIINNEDAQETLCRLARHLHDDGILLLEIETVHALPNLNVWRQSTWKQENNDTITLQQYASLEGDICRSLCRYVLFQKGTATKTEVETMKVKIYSDDLLVEMLYRAGFENVRRMKAYDITLQPDANDPAIIYECKK